MYLSYFDKFKHMSPYLYISPDEWSYIKNTYSEHDIRTSLVEVAMGYDLPYQDISEKDAYVDFQKLKSIQWYDFLVDGDWFSRSEYNTPISPQYFKRTNIGNKSSNYFQQKNRWMVDGTISPGPARTWSTPKFMYTLFRALFTLDVDKVDRGTIRTLLALRKYTCSQFKPSVAKMIFDIYNSTNILDFSAGWGDRLAGFYAANNSKFYLGIDPRVENHPLYHKQAKFYETHLGWFENKKTSKFICSPAEDVDLSEYQNTFDMVFTSPPYFNVERYSYDDTQSWIRYKDINDWNTLFLHKSLSNLWPTLKSGATIIINISDVNTTHKGKKQGYLKICDPMVKYITEELGGIFDKCIGMEFAKRPNSIGVGNAVVTSEKNREEKYIIKKTGIFAEPMWIFHKK